MNTGAEALRILMEARLRRDLSADRAKAAAAIARAEAKAYLSGMTEDSALTPLQERIRDDINECDNQLTALFDAVGIPPDTADPRVFATVCLVGTLMARITELETRVTALERAARS